jgi:cytosine/adenosine deaminase-related metal-dependent hydrolase
MTAETLIIDGCAIATVDDLDQEYASGHLVIRNGRIDVVGDGPAPAVDGARRVDGSGCLATPGLVNVHHHLYQWITRGYAQDGTLFEWLTALYPVWRHLDTDLEYHAARAALASLALSGCTTTTDHHYLFPRDGGDVFAAEVEAARQIGLRFHPGRGSMDLGQSRGGLPPDDVVEDRDEILAACEHAVATYHDPAPDSMLRVALAPCSPFSVTGDLLRESADLARRLGVRMHTHLAETVDEAEFCLGKFGYGPVDYVEQMGWLGDDVWLAHCVHLSSSDIAKFAASGTAVAHCPSSNGRLGSGIAPIPELLASGAPVGLGVDGVASNEHGGLAGELRQAVLVARCRKGPKALTVRQALRVGTMGGARCLGRQDEIGSLQAGKLADIALWRIDDLGHADIADPVCAIVLGPPATLQLLLVGGSVVVEAGEMRMVDSESLARHARDSAGELARRAGVSSAG